MDSLKEKTAKGIFWSALNNGITQVLSLVIGIFLARLLSPADYGIVGVLTIFTVIAGNLQSSGFTQGLINQKVPTARDYNSVFWFNIIASFCIYAILFAAAPLIARFFHEPRLVSLSRFVFLGFVISSFGIAHSAYMMKNMMNREIAIIGLLALLASGATGIILALNGKSYWSLAWQQIVYISVLNVGRYHYVAWHPRMHLDFEPVRRMFGFSVNILFTNIINTLSNNVLTFIFGRLYPMRAVGNFSQAYKWDTLANSFVSGTVGQIAQTVLVSVSDERERQKRIFRKLMRFTAFLSFPCMLGLSLVSREFILVTLSDKWIDSVVLLQILCVSGAFIPFYTLYQNLTISNGRSDIYLWCNISQIVLQIGIILLLRDYGITTMCVAYTAFTIGWLLAWQLVARKLLGLRFVEMMADTMPFLMAAAAVMGLTYWLTSSITNNIVLLLARIAIATLLYVAIMKLARVQIMDDCLTFIAKKIGKR